MKDITKVLTLRDTTRLSKDTHPVFVNMKEAEVGVVEESCRVNVYRGLATTLAAQAPVRVD